MKYFLVITILLILEAIIIFKWEWIERIDSRAYLLGIIVLIIVTGK